MFPGKQGLSTAVEGLHLARVSEAVGPRLPCLPRSPIPATIRRGALDRFARGGGCRGSQRPAAGSAWGCRQGGSSPASWSSQSWCLREPQPALPHPAILSISSIWSPGLRGEAQERRAGLCRQFCPRCSTGAYIQPTRLIANRLITTPRLASPLLSSRLVKRSPLAVAAGELCGD